MHPLHSCPSLAPLPAYPKLPTKDRILSLADVATSKVKSFFKSAGARNKIKEDDPATQAYKALVSHLRHLKYCPACASYMKHRHDGLEFERYDGLMGRCAWYYDKLIYTISNRHTNAWKRKCDEEYEPGGMVKETFLDKEGRTWYTGQTPVPSTK